MSTRLKGSNQHRAKTRIFGLKPTTWRDIIIIIFATALIAYVGFYGKQRESRKIISPLAMTAFAMDDNAMTPTYKDSQLAQPDTNWMQFTKKAQELAPIYDFPVKVLLAQAALESNRGQSHFAQVRNNYFGIGAYDSNPDLAFSYVTEGECIVEYMRLIKKNFPEAYAARSNPGRMIELLKHNKAGNMYATDPNYTEKLKSLPEWRNN